MTMYSDDIKLVEDVLSGRQNAFLLLMNKHQRLVYHVVYRLIPNKSDHEDLGQDIFLKVYAKLKTYKAEAKLSTWIARIAYNTCLNYLEKKKHSLMDDLIKTHDNEEEASSLMENVRDDDLLPDVETENLISSEILQREIEKLPVTYKIILTLYHLEFMKYKEIAEITDLPEGTVKSYLFRARQMLKNILIKEYSMEDLCL